MELLEQVADAAVAPAPVDEHPRQYQRPRITLRTSRVNRLLGTSLTDRDVLAALGPLGIDVQGAGESIGAVPPSFRPDLEREVDLVEEVARRIGFGAIGRTVPKPADQVGALSRRQRERRDVADALVGLGASEGMTVPLVAPESLLPFGGDAAVELANPLRAEESVLRTTLVPGLLAAAALNGTRSLPDVCLFEQGTVFRAARRGRAAPTRAGGRGRGDGGRRDAARPSSPIGPSTSTTPSTWRTP